jgi:hypothetical protein
MRRLVMGGLGVVAVAWALGSSDWRGYVSEFWTTARAQLGTSDSTTNYRSSNTDTSARTEAQPQTGS